MKNLIILFVLLFSINSFAQVDKQTEEIENPEFTSNEIKFDTDKNTVELIGNVSFKTDLLELENADKILYNRTTNEIIVSGLKDFTIDGAIQVADNPNKNILRYKIGQKIAYID